MSEVSLRSMKKTDEALLSKACGSACDRLEEEYGICIGTKRANNSFGRDSKDCLILYTLATTFLEEIARAMGDEVRRTNGEVKVSLHDFMTFGVNLRESEDAEKDGNYTIVLAAGPMAKLMIKNDALTEAEE